LRRARIGDRSEIGQGAIHGHRVGGIAAQKGFKRARRRVAGAFARGQRGFAGRQRRAGGAQVRRAHNAALETAFHAFQLTGARLHVSLSEEILFACVDQAVPGLRHIGCNGQARAAPVGAGGFGGQGAGAGLITETAPDISGTAGFKHG